MLKILHILPFYYPAFKFGGPSVSEYKMDKTLAKKGLVLDVFTTNAGLEKRKDIVTNQWIIDEGVRIKYFPYYFKDNYTFSPQMFWTILKEAKNYDLIHLQLFWAFPTLAGSIGALLNKKPYVISPGGALYREAIYMKSKNIKKFYHYMIATHYANSANAILYTTEDERNNVADFLRIKAPSFIVPIGIDLNEYKDLSEKGLFKKKYSILKDKKYILFLGRINPKKGIDILLESYRGILKEYKELFLVIAGHIEENYLLILEKQINDSGLSDRILLPGILAGKEKLSAYIDAEIFVLPSYSENFAVTIIEAMACGTPVVISNKVGIYDMVQKYDAGLIVNLDPQSLINGIKQLLDTPTLRYEYVENGKRLIKDKYDIDKVADVMIDAYSNVLNKNI